MDKNFETAYERDTTAFPIRIGITLRQMLDKDGKCVDYYMFHNNFWGTRDLELVSPDATLPLEQVREKFKEVLLEDLGDLDAMQAIGEQFDSSFRVERSVVFTGDQVKDRVFTLCSLNPAFEVDTTPAYDIFGSVVYLSGLANNLSELYIALVAFAKASAYKQPAKRNGLDQGQETA